MALMEPVIGNFTATVNGFITGRMVAQERSFYRPMLRDIRRRVEERLEALGISAAAASRDAGLGQDAIRNLQRAADQETDRNRRGVSTSTLVALAGVLQTTASWLLEGGEQSESANYVPVVGRVGAGARVEAIQDDQPKFISIPFVWSDAVALQVIGDSCYPIYEAGEFIVIRGEQRLVVEECLNRMCVVETEDGVGLVKRVLDGGGGTFYLESPNAPGMPNQRLASARPVQIKINPQVLAA
jgi:phage repressor protein C with HTH and peptisase S24 domain